MTPRGDLQPERRTFSSLQCGRGLAALMVVIYHTSVIFRIPDYWSVRPFGDIPRFLDCGVDFFFVLSGFIILHAHARDIGQPEALWPYLKRRLARIYPLYWICFGVAVVPFMLKNASPTMSRLVSEFLLIPASYGVPDQKIIAVSWTLCYEIAFYAAFMTFILDRRIGALVLGAWFVASFYWIVDDTPSHWTILASPYSALFVIGMGLQRLWSARVHVAPLGPLLLGGILFSLAAVNRIAPFGLPVGLSQILYGTAFALLILVALDAEERGTFVAPLWMRRLGDCSYSLYLVHFLVLSLLAKVLTRIPVVRFVPTQIIFGVLVIAAVAVGFATHVLVEKPLLRLVAPRRTTVPVAA